MNVKNIPNRFHSKFITPYVLKKKYGSILIKNKALENTKRGRRCFILGTGPSINEQNVLKLKDEETFVVNTFWNYPKYLTLNPKYYVVVDTYNFPNAESRGSAWIEDLIKREKIVSQLPTKLFFNIAGKEFIEKNGLYKNNEVYYLAFHRFFTEDLKFNIEIDKVLPNVKNVILACLITALYMGFEEVYLLGCEHNFLVYPSNLHYEKFKMFHDLKMNVNDPEEIKKYALDIAPYERHIDHAKILFKNYRLFYQKAKQLNPKFTVYNATPNSFLDVFEFINFSDIKLESNEHGKKNN